MSYVGLDPRLTDSRTPGGTAGGDMEGTYPNPTVDLHFPRWRKYTIGFAALQIAALTNSALLLTLPIKGTIEAIHADVATAFLGTAIATLAATIGDAGNNARYLTSFNLLATGLLVPSAAIFIPSMSATTDVKLYATAVGANLSALSQGSVNVWIKWAVLP